MNEATLDKKIKLWEDQLLDLGKRNKMISFRETKRATLKILKPSFSDLYQQLVEDEKELTFQKAIDRDSDVRVYSILSLLDKLSCPMEVNIGDIRAEGSLPEIKKTLKHLRSKARLALDEQGTNILYLVFGFLEWREKGNRADNWIRSPLILVPVTLSLPSLNAQYSLKKHEDEIVVNPTLAYLFERDYGITLPDFDSDKDSLESFMQKMEKLVDERGWRVIRDCSMGLVSFLKISMYNDLIRNETQLKTNPIVRAFAGEQNEVNSMSGDAYAFDHDACKAVDSYQVLDADSSQQDAIMLSQKGISFVMQGPPGTGKSQTITNIIAQGLADGKKILFVSEKMAALDVVYRRLTDVHLADFCLSLHSHKANKKEILNQLGNNLDLQRIKVKAEEIAKLTRLDMIKEQLKAYVQDIHTTIMPLEMSLYEVYGSILELGNLPDIDLHLPDVDKLTKDDVNRLALLVMNLDKAQGVLGPQWYKNPWQGITGSYLEVSQKRELQNKLQDAIRILAALEECKLVEKTLADVMTLDSLDSFWALCEHSRYCDAIPSGWFFKPTEQEERMIHSLREMKNTINELNCVLSEKFDSGLFTFDGESLRLQFTQAISNCRSILRHVSSDEDAFNRLETDYQQLLHLHEASELLLDAFKVITEEYHLELPCEYQSIETVFTVCGMFLEKRNLTAWYFGKDNLQHLKQYVEDLHNKLKLFERKKQHLCERYSENLLNAVEVEQFLQQLDSAMEILEEIHPDINYSTLKTIAAFDIAKIERIVSTQNEKELAYTASKYGFAQPSSITTVQRQINAFEAIPGIQIVPSWQTAANRSTANKLLWSVADNTKRLTTAKAKLQIFFSQTGITLDTTTLTVDEFELFRKISDEMPEAEAIIANCNNRDALLLLDTIDSNSHELDSLTQTIKDFRAEYHITENIDNVGLLQRLMELRSKAEFCMPSLVWADEKMAAYDLLEQIISLTTQIKEQHNQFAATYENTVFTLDYAAILNRFKAEYTNFFKVFKASYKEDVKQIRLVFKEVRKKVSDEEIIVLLQALRKYNEDLEEYHNLSAQAARLLDVQQYDIWFDWEGVKKRLDAFSELCPIFRNSKDAHHFIVTVSWNDILELLTKYDVLTKWFSDNSQAKTFFGSLYAEKNTDTTGIRKLLDHAKCSCSIFESPKHYLQFLTKCSNSDNFQNSVKQAQSILEIRDWFTLNAGHISEYTGISYDESSSPWDTLITHLESYEDIAAVFGDQAAYQLVMNYHADQAHIAKYQEALMILAETEDCVRVVFDHKAIDAKIADTDINELCKSMLQMISCADKLMQLYSFAARYCPDSYAELSIRQLESDLEAVQYCQKTYQQMALIDQEAHSTIGSDYSSFTTDWNAVQSNIAFCEKVDALLSGNVTYELLDAFIKGTSLYTEVQLSELWEYFKNAKLLENKYSELSYIQDQTAKIQTLANVLSSLKAAIDAKNTVARFAYDECNYIAFNDCVHKLALVQSANKSYVEEIAKAQKMMPTLALTADTNWTDTVSVFDHMRQVKRAVSSGSMDVELNQFLTNSIPGTKISSCYEIIEKMLRYRSYFTDITSMFANKAMLESLPLTKLGKKFRNCNDQFATMDAWIDLRDCKKACQIHGLEEFIVKAEDAYYPAGALKDVFLKSFYYEWFEKVCSGIESVANFRVRTQETRVSDFRELDTHQLPVDQMRIRERLIREMPTRYNFGRATDEMSILLKELGKKSKIKPIRKLFREIPNLVLRLKPCLMMSPLSVSYFLEAETYKFDMVIFDEASQIFPQDAIGAIFRGKQVIIAGDSKQLPPTNFFAASTNNDTDFDIDDEDEEDIVFDSILEEATNSLPNRSLLWHYRSRYEDLISFSNQEIYQNNLITFPSSTTHVADTGVEYVYVKNGVYENRCNRMEAQQIVQMVADHIKNHPDRSLGIIAFSESQQSVIEDEINKFRMKNPFFERFFDEDKDEPFFVKNLENVQGDERDTIIFSICYGKNAQGKMYMRFGPLGHQGGERRLNVAITRAKHNIKLVGSILPEDIDLSKTHSEGVRMLRSYIGFAMHGSATLAKREKKNALYDVDTFSEQVGKFLTDRGCKVQMNVGNSDYTIDIAVEHPKRPGYYIAGIECDGNSYYMARTVRDREHLRTAVLERMGWKMYRVWSTEWIRNPISEQERLMKFIRESLLHYGESSNFTPANDASDLVGTEIVKAKAPDHTVDPNNPYGFPDYEEGKWWEVGKYRASDNLSMLADRIYAVVKVEQPIHLDLLYRRMADAFGMTKASQSVRDTVDEAIRKRMRNEVYISDEFVQIIGNNKIKVRRSDVGNPDRNIEHISIPEIAAAMERILVGAFGMERSVLCSEAARVFGYERSGAKIKQRTNEAVEYLVRNHKVSVCDGKIQLLEE